MTARFAPPLHRIVLGAQDDFAGWRDAARALLAADVAPEQIGWVVTGAAVEDLFAAVPSATLLPVGRGAGLNVPRALLAQLRLALLHSDPGRFALGYRILWRSRATAWLAKDPADADMIALRGMAKSVRRDMHKMHAFVRFRKVGETGERERFAAWFEPQHHIGRAVAGFFRARFTGIDWLIVTPDVSIAWDGKALSEGPGGCRSDVPPDGADGVEAEWRAYYSHIFNPARVKVAAMKREMPVRYWRNLPEAMLIPDLIGRAERRVEAMVERSVAKGKGFPLFDASEPDGNAEARHFASLGLLYEALRTTDAAPSPGFSGSVVAGEGPPGAHIMLVGEQPADREDMAGRPFVGPAGQLLDACLNQAGLDRGQLFLTNAVKRFKYEQRGKRRLHATPNAGDIAHYRWWLKEEIRLVNPAVIIALGATALQALTGHKQALSPLRGALMPWEGRNLLVTVHPSFLLRLPDEQGRAIERAKFVRDLALAAEVA